MTKKLLLPIQFHGNYGRIGFDVEATLTDDDVIVVKTNDPQQNQYRFDEAQLVTMLREIRIQRRTRALRNSLENLLGGHP